MTTSTRILLGVNIDHVATLRQARGTRYPDPVKAALDAEEAGADGITVHLREDRRHIQERDVLVLKDVLQTRMNFEMGVTEEMMQFAERIRPAHICLVPETRQELTTEGGLDVAGQEARIKAAVERLSYFYMHESCGQCTPCREGTGWLWRMVDRIETGRGRPEDIDLLDNVAENIQGRTICALGDAAAMPVRAFIKHYRDEFVHHIEHKTCTVPAYL